jgi:exodeoxyribonuclease V alpha subunit
MKSTLESSTQENLAGLVERVTFHNAENGFCVLRAKARGHRDLVTVIGHAAVISAGEWITASGEWINDRAHGQQFKARFLKTSAPTSIDGIERYLGSGMIRRIGPVYAKKMVKSFGEKVFDVIEAEPDRLREVTGIGVVRAKRITDAWAEQKVVREIMVFLHSNGVGTARAVRIFKTYGADAVHVMTENPYRLARDIRGIGFKSADAIAMKLGIEKTAMIRLRAGVSYALTEAMDEGHCGLPTDQLIPLAEELLEAPRELILTALELERSEGVVTADRVGETACIFLAGLYRSERAIAFEVESGVVPVTGQNAVLDAAPIERETHVRAPVVEREDAPAVVDDEDRAMGAVHNEPAVCFSSSRTPASVKPVFGMSMSVPSAFNSSEAIGGRHDPRPEQPARRHPSKLHSS